MIAPSKVVKVLGRVGVCRYHPRSLGLHHISPICEVEKDRVANEADSEKGMRVLFH